MPANRYPCKDPLCGARALHIASYALILMSTSLSAPAQEQSQPPTNPPPQAGQTSPQADSKPPDAPVEPERWNLFYQATSIGQYHGTFYSPYSGPFSLQDYTERAVSLTTTLFFGLRLENNTVLYFDPEVAG